MPTLSTATEPAKTKSAVIFMYSETPVHAGASAGRGGLDQPIQRSVQTTYPILNDATVRGALRRLAGDRAAEWFGDEQQHEGRFSTPDAEVLLFPVSSARGVVAWITCPAVLRRFSRKLDLYRSTFDDTTKVRLRTLEEHLESTMRLLPSDSQAALAVIDDGGCALAWEMKVIIESDCFTIAAGGKCNGLADWFADNALPLGDAYWKNMVRKHMIILNDLAFKHYALRSTEIRTRVKIDNGIAASSGPWNEENLPVDTLLYTVLTEIPAQDERNAIALGAFLQHVKANHRNICQLGGEQTLGRGILRLRDLKSDPEASMRR